MQNDLNDTPDERRLTRPWELAYDERTNLDDILSCFRLILGRYPHIEEWPGHSSQVGQPLTRIVQSYFKSKEFMNRGLLKGEMPAGIIQRHNGRFYVLGDPSELMLHGPSLVGSYEPPVAAVFDMLLKPGDFVVDIGANLGYFTFLAASLVGSDGCVYAIEPNDLNVKLLESARQANGFENIRVLQVGASDKIETLFLYATVGNGSTSSITKEDIFGSRTVPGLPVDVLVSGRRKKVSLVKIDVEGFEYKALTGARRMLEEDEPYIIFEFARNGIEGISGAEFLKWLADFGYTFANISGGKSIQENQSIDEILADYQAAGVDHIDVLAKPIRA